MFGDNLLVVPCTQVGGEVEFYLPQGQWLRFPGQKTFTGGGVPDKWRLASDACILDIGLADVGDWVRIVDVRKHGHKPISSRFVYQIKTRLGGVLEAFCRWTPRGFEEIPDVHFNPDDIFDDIGKSLGTTSGSAIRSCLCRSRQGHG